MFSTAYDTLACRNYQTNEIEKALRIALLDKGTLLPFDDNWSAGILRVTNELEDIPMFSHPFKIEVDSGNDKGTPFYSVDVRPFTSYKMGVRKINNYREYTLLMLRATLNMAWDQFPEELHSTGELPVIVFMRWFSNAIQSKLGLSAEEQVRLNIVTVFYWYSLFRNEEFSEREKMKIVSKISQVSFIPATEVLKVADKLTYIRGIEDYCSTVIEIVGSTRLENFNPAQLFAMMGMSWFGLNAKELIAVATEHPPTFISIVHAALDSRDYRRTVLGNLVYQNDKKGRGSDFNKALSNIIKNVQ